MKKTVICVLIALISLAWVILCIKMFLASGNGLWAIWAVLGAAIKVAAISDAIEQHMDERFLDRFYGKGGNE